MNGEKAVAVERQPPEEAFGLLSNDLRVSIVRTLGEVGEPLTFSSLREAIDERDSGKFNYHLGKLTGHYVTKDEDGYRLSLAGTQVYGAILSGAYTTNAGLEAFEFQGPCPLCGSHALVAEYADEQAKLYCPDCEEWRNEFSFPPANLTQYTREELPYAFDRWMHATVMKVLQGFCSNCSGRVVGQLERAQADSPIPVRAVFECERCGDTLTAGALLPVLFDPRTISLFEKQGVDVLHDPSWRYFDAGTGFTVEMTEEDPLTAQVSIEFTEETLVADIGSDGSVVNVWVE